MAIPLMEPLFILGAAISPSLSRLRFEWPLYFAPDVVVRNPTNNDLLF
jgi:hypothetical protein